MNEVSPPTFEAMEPRVLFAANWLYGVDSGESDGSSNLFRIDHLSGALVDIGEIGYKVRDITFTPDGELWGVTDTRLIHIDREFGFGDDRGIVGFGGGGGGGGGDGDGEAETTSTLNALASDAGGRLFAATTDGKLVRFEPRDFIPRPPEDIETSIQGEYGRDYLSSGDLVFDENSILYATGHRENRQSFLLQINARTGYSYPVNGRATAPIGGRAAEGLVIGPSKQMYAVVRGNQANPVIVRVNRNTGAGTPIANISNADGMVGLASKPLGDNPLNFLLEQVNLAAEQSLAQAYNVGVKYAGFVSATLDNGAGADIYLDLADYYSSLFDRTDFSREGDNDFVTLWVDKHDPVDGSAMPFDLGAVPLRFQGAATDPTGQFMFGRLLRDYPYRRDPLVEVTDVRIESDARDIDGLEGSAKAIWGSQTSQFGPDDPSLYLARVEIRRQTLQALMLQAAQNIEEDPFFGTITPEGAAQAIAEQLLVEDGDSVAFNYAQFAPWQIRAFTATDSGVTPGPGADNAFDLGTVVAGASSQRYGVGWVGPGTQSNYFSFTVTGTGPIQIHLPRLDGNVSLFLENPAGNVVAFSAKAGTQEESITRTLTAGTYFVRVQSANPYDAGFSIRVAATEPTSAPVAALLANQQRPSATVSAAETDAADDELDLLGGEALATL